MAKTKKVIILIVEGQSEESLLAERLKELAKDSLIYFAIENGDILNRENNTKGIKATIGDLISDVIRERKYKRSDILAVLHIVDTDGSFIDDNNILIKPTQNENTVYHSESITVKNSSQKAYIERRNDKRQKAMLTMKSTNSVMGGKILYQMYYFSRNVEHVLFNEQNPTVKEKVENIDDFLENLDIPIEQFLMKWLPIERKDLLVGQYEGTWDFIESNTNSLKRATNVSLLFNTIDELLQ